MIGPAPRSCEVCQKTDGLLRCGGCQAVYYCGQGHQVADREKHKSGCIHLKKWRSKYEKEEKKLRELPGEGPDPPPRLFDTEAGRFWKIVETRPYMQARYTLVDGLVMLYGQAGGRVDVVQTALDHLLDMMRLCRGDNMGVRDLIPALYIRLGRDQDAYDFLKWHALVYKNKSYDWGDMNEPFLDVKNADVLESPADFWPEKPYSIELSLYVAVTLIKVRLLLDLMTILTQATGRYGDLPAELRGGKAVSGLVQSRPELLNGGEEGLNHLVQTVTNQIKHLYKAIEKSNPHVWHILFTEGEEAGNKRPDNAYSRGTKDEARLVLCYNYAAWAETPGAIDVIQAVGQES